MMKMHVDTAYRSLFKYGEELCGDPFRDSGQPIEDYCASNAAFHAFS